MTTRWVLGLVVLVMACKAKREEPARAMPERAVASPEEKAVALPSEPSSCAKYRAAVERISKCETLPRSVRDALKDTFAQLTESWKDLPASMTATLDDACASALAAIDGISADDCKVAGAPAGSRDVPGEKGVPLDQAVLGPLPHPFGALEVLQPTSKRDEILSALPNAQRDGDNELSVPVGVEALIATVGIDENDELDDVELTLPLDALDMLTKAWGKPTSSGAWFDHKRRWRADWSDGDLMIGPFTPAAEVYGTGPEGLRDTRPILGATRAQLAQRYGKRLVEADNAETDDAVATDDAAAEDPSADDTTYKLIQPATEHCHIDTHVYIRVHADKATKVVIEQCFEDVTTRRAALASLERAWGRAIPTRTGDDHLVFTFARPQRRFEMREDPEGGAWRIAITSR